MKGKKSKVFEICQDAAERQRLGILEHNWHEATAPDIVGPLTREVFAHKTLYHYTGLSAGIEILKAMVDNENRISDASAICFTHYRFLNDSDEYELGIELGKRILDNARGTFSKGHSSDVNQLIGEGLATGINIPYVLSLSDAEDSTAHWQTYSDANEGGMALGFDIKLLLEELNAASSLADEKTLSENGFGKYLFAPCVYCNKKEVRGVGVAKMSDLANAIPNLFYDIIEKRGTLCSADFAHWVTGRIFQFAALIKGKDYSFEREWRIVVRPTDEDYYKDVEIIGKKPRLRPKDIPFHRCLTKIVCSPHGNRERIRMIAELMSRKFNREIEVVESRSSYVGE